MEHRRLAELQRHLDRIFIERELFVRANDKVRYLRLSPRLQQTIAAFCLIGLGWLAYSTLGVFFQTNAVTIKNAELQRQKLAYLELLTEVGEYHEQFARLSQNLESNQAYLLEQLERAASGSIDATEVREGLTDSRSERSRIALAGEALREKLAEVESELGEIVARNDALRSKVAETRDRFDAADVGDAQMDAAREFIGQRLRRLESDLAAAQEKGGRLQGALDSATAELKRAGEEQRSLLAENAELRSGIAGAKRELAAAASQGKKLEATVAELESALEAAVRQKENLQAERSRLLAEASGLKEQLTTSSNRQGELSGMIASLESELGAALGRADDIERDRAQYKKATLDLGERLQAAAAERAQLDRTIVELEATLAEAQERSKHLEVASAEYQSRAAALEERLNGAGGERATLAQRVETLQGYLKDAEKRGERLAQERDFYETRVASLEQRLNDMRDMQQTMVRRLSEKTLTSMDAIERTVAMTGVDINFLLSNVIVEGEGMGQGGPFVPGDYISETDPTYQLQASVALLDLQMDRWEALQKVVRQLPLVAPLDTYRITSGFGSRTDPINGRKARHLGLDFSAPLRSPVFTTAPGKVVFAGWRGRYGRMIEIDHGLGVHTRYAHLKKILVKPGEVVVHREKIGLLGSSGRSTGPHVHYEILVDGKPVDPSKFLEAGRHVFKG